MGMNIVGRYNTRREEMFGKENNAALLHAHTLFHILYT
jgi:hypothetical protein